MQTALPTLPVQFSTEVKLPNHPVFKRVQIFFTPMIRAGCDPHFDYSYFNFTFEPRDGGKPVEHYFMPRVRWHEGHREEWAKVTAQLPADFDLELAFYQKTIDLVL